MKKFDLAGKWLKLYGEEIGLFFFAAGLLFLIRSSNILFDNYAETAFLKRFGVKYLPFVTAVVSISTFFVMGFMSGWMVRISSSRLLTRVLLFCGISVGMLRFVVPLDFHFIYPLLYVLKAQYEVVLGVLFWNLANDLFDTRQSKRIFPLVTSGGLLGGITGSFLTPALVKLMAIDNLMVVYLFTTGAAAFLTARLDKAHPSSLMKRKEKKRSSDAFLGEFSKVLAVIKESRLTQILIVLTLVANLVIPVMNYQFNYAVDQSYARERGMIDFFGYFKGVQNIIGLAISLFASRVYARFGLPVAMMFHPFNYMVAFAALLLRFDLFSAMYARLSTASIRNSINMPAMAVLQGLFPPSYHTLIRPFLRGTVVRVGVLGGSGLILIMQKLGPPRYLSIAGMALVSVWILTTFILKKNYSKILADLLSKSMLDLSELGERDMRLLGGTETFRKELTKTFMSSQGADAVWYGKALKAAGIEELDQCVLEKLEKEDDETKLALLPLLSRRAGRRAADTFLKLVDPAKPDLMIAFARTARRVCEDMEPALWQEVFERAKLPEVKAYALTALVGKTSVDHLGVVLKWLRSERLPERRAGVIAAGEVGDALCIEKLQEMVRQETDPSILALILRSLYKADLRGLNEMALSYMASSSESVRLAALESYEIHGEPEARHVVSLLGDPSQRVRNAAVNKLRETPREIGSLLQEALLVPNRWVREGVFAVAESLKITDVQVLRFARAQLERAFHHTAECEGIQTMAESHGRNLLLQHVSEKREACVDNVLRVLALRDSSGMMRKIWRTLRSPNTKLRANGLEALDSTLDRSMSKMVLPLIERSSWAACLEQGRKHFEVPQFAGRTDALLRHLLESPDELTQFLAIDLLFHPEDPPVVGGPIESLTTQADGMAKRLLVRLGFREDDHERDVDVIHQAVEKMIMLSQSLLFKDLPVQELARLAPIAKEQKYDKNNAIMGFGAGWEGVSLIIQGEVTVEEEPLRSNVLTIEQGDSLGLTFLFTTFPRTLIVRAKTDVLLLTLDKEDFMAHLAQYPAISLQMCKVLSARIRSLYGMIGIELNRGTLDRVSSVSSGE
jgi:CRP-like cAMP-binding protein